MAEQLKLAWRPDIGSDVDALDLLPWLAETGYEQAISHDGKPVDEVITLHVPGTSDDNLATQTQALDLKAKEIEWSRRPTQANAVWLVRQQAGETNARRACVSAMRRGPAKVTSVFAEQSRLVDYPVGITRGPYWENTSIVTLSSASISLLGGTLAYSLNGDVPGRAASLTLNPTQPGGGLTLQTDEFWIGCKTAREGGDPAHFQPVWDLTAAGTLGADTTVSGSTLVCTFATTTAMAARATISIDDAVASAGNWAAQAGQYIVLMRCNITGTLVADVRLAVGYAGTTNFSTGDHESVSEINPTLHALDTAVNLPPSYAGAGTLGQVALRIEAEKVSGTGNLVMEKLVLIPSLEGSLHGHSTVPAKSSTASVLQQILALQRPSGLIIGNVYDATTSKVLDIYHPDDMGWGVPAGSGIIVLAGQAFENPAPTAMLELQVYERWATLRGNAT